MTQRRVHATGIHRWTGDHVILCGAITADPYTTSSGEGVTCARCLVALKRLATKEPPR